jgi:hypothetical protein
VPAVSESSKAGQGSTWIGVQDPRWAGGPFIQVGTIDERDGAGFDDYYAFWSDTAHHFHPVGMLSVLPGERVSATLALVGHRWRIRLVDHTSQQTRQVFTRNETHAVLRQAEWLQEDPSFGTYPHVRRLPYAPTVPVHFSALRANGSVPRAHDLFAATMVLPHTDLAPNAVHRDAFTVIAGRSDLPSLTPPAAFTSGTARPPTTGIWKATGTVISSEGYSDDAPGMTIPRTWIISRSCPSQSSCSYTLDRTFGDESGLSTIQATLVHTAGGWRAVWPPERSVCRTDALGPVHWTQHEVWLIRFVDHGTVAEAHGSSFSDNPTCGFGRSSINWRATLVHGS